MGDGGGEAASNPAPTPNIYHPSPDDRRYSLKIVVCVKQVPDTTAEKRLTSELFLDRNVGESILNPFDEHAIDEALRIRERMGGEVTALCMGPPNAKETIRKAVAMGANGAILVSDSANRAIRRSGE